MFKITNIAKLSAIFVLAALVLLPLSVIAQNKVIDANSLLARVIVSVSPKSATFIEGSTFEVPIILNTLGQSVNGIEVKVNFDPNKLSVIKPSGGQSIIGVWVEPPSYDNTRGHVSYVGVVPNGIVTGSGVVGTITFKAKATGQAVVSVSSDSDILLNDGLGTKTIIDLGRAEYSLVAKPPEGVRVFSETHPFSAEWYNNDNPIIAWDRDPGVTGFSYILDDKPATIPENQVNTTDTTKAYESLADGLWYFHVKAYKNGVWGSAGHFLIKIDTTPPAKFEPEVNYVLAAVALVERSLVSFFTTDNLSGIDHYEVGVIDKSQPLTRSPVFVQSDSPFQVPQVGPAGAEVIVRAIDGAGNVRDVSVDVRTPFAITKFIKDYLVYILLGIILLALFMLILHYLVGHHIASRLRRAFKIATEEDKLAERPKMPNPYDDLR